MLQPATRGHDCGVFASHLGSSVVHLMLVCLWRKKHSKTEQIQQIQSTGLLKLLEADLGVMNVSFIMATGYV